jgi:hypothetical protein
MTKPVLLLSFVLVCAPAIQPQQERGSDAAPIVLANDKLELAIGTTGGGCSKIVLRDGEQLSPLAAIGHFLALDGFGAPSDQGRALGMPFPGEASRPPVKIVAMRASGPMRLITMQTRPATARTSFMLRAGSTAARLTCVSFLQIITGLTWLAARWIQAVDSLLSPRYTLRNI